MTGGRTTLLLLAVLAAACTPPAPTPSTATPTAGTPTAAPGTATPTASPAVPPPPPLALELVADGLDDPIGLVGLPDDGRLFVLEQPGRILILDGTDRRVFLDLTDRVRAGGERGLFALAFHPRRDGRFYVHYTDRAGDTTLEEYRADPAYTRADPASARRLLHVAQPASNHNGGMLTFGPDGMLYLGLGDGGGAADQFGNGQDPHTLLGAILRLDVDGGDPYAVPPDNPFADGADGAPEVWAYGLRNPWRFWFDDGLIYIADVGQDRYEEIDVLPVEAAAGANFGWPITEASHCFRPPRGCDTTGLVLPVHEYRLHEGGTCAVVGGPVYRGTRIPGLVGRYLFGDFCAGRVWSFRYEAGGVADLREHTEELGARPRLRSFGVDSAGEVYLLAGDAVWRLVPAGS